MKQRKIMTIALISGVMCAVCFSLFMWSLQHQADEEHIQMLERYGGEQVEVCVTTRDIAAGERIDASSLEKRLWVASLLPDEAVCDAKEAIGKIATTSIMKGEVIVAKRFQKNTALLDIPAGFQAVSVPVKAVQAVGGSIQSGMRVDVYATGDTTTSALVTNVLVLDTSIGDSESLTNSGSGWITLAIEPKRVQEMVAAANKTSLYFTIPGEQIAGQQQSSSDELEESFSSPISTNKSTSTEKEGNDGWNRSTVSR